MPLDIKDSIKWSLVISDKEMRSFKTLSFQQSLFLSEDENFGEDGLLLLEYLQEVYYVTKFDYILKEDNSFDNIDKDVLDNRDEGWEILINIFGSILQKIYRQKRLLTADDSYENWEQLFRLKGEAYGEYIRSVMRGVYPLRYEIYTVMKQFIPMSLREINNLKRCTDIVCDGRAFQLFFKLSIEWLEKTQLNLQTFESDSLEKLMKQLSQGRDGFGRFRKKYIKSNGCFSKTLLYDGSNFINLLCFSGAQEPTGELKTAIESIADCGLFGIHQLITLPAGTRYMLSEARQITLADAIISGLYDQNHHGRMFSCCERKTFAGYKWQSCKWFHMIVKYRPCELCEDMVKIYEEKYHGVVTPGKECSSKPLHITYDGVATAIHRKLHPLLLQP